MKIVNSVTTADVAAYRERGLKLSADPAHSNFLLPEIPANTRRILDIGCHAGHVFEVLRLPPYCEVFGCDIDAEALAVARKCLPHATFSFAKAEELPYENSYFDFVFARSTAYLLDIPKALSELNRVLRPGGRLWISSHRWRDIHVLLRGPFYDHPIKTTVFGTYVAVNSALFHFTGRLVRYPLNRSRVMTFQTEDRMRKELQKAGFGRIRVSDNRHFVIDAEKLDPVVRLKEWIGLDKLIKKIA
ncbi:MAG TPA: class I SAM-dependent methyltransferase [Candidatus Sulfotelmatobacter sp.]|nr:class I SAM-dependent methyltransferase [Candidatus Sulfotelmatobacter sp.]